VRPRARADPLPRPHGRAVTGTRVRADVGCPHGRVHASAPRPCGHESMPARTRPRINADAGRRPDGHFHPKTSVMTSLALVSIWLNLMAFHKAIVRPILSLYESVVVS
jgi:hypothetical protein